jgi:Tol biopolymer transport system component
MSSSAVSSVPRRRLGFSRFDLAAAATALAALLLTALMLWRGDRVGMEVVAIQPAGGSSGVSTRATFSIVFDELIQIADVRLTVDPPLAGALTWEGDTLRFTPAEPLAENGVYQVTLQGDLRSVQGHRLLEPVSWSFRTGAPRVLFMGWDAADRGQLYAIAPEEGAAPQPLTAEASNVIDYGVSLDGQWIAYSVYRPEDGGGDLWLIGANGDGRRQLLACDDALCSQPAWSHDGARIIYERRPISVPGAPPGSPRLWWLDLASGQTVSVFRDTQVLGLGARFAPDGRWVSYLSPLAQEIHVFDLESGRTLRIPSRAGEPAVWRPDGGALLLADIQVRDERYAVHLFRLDLATETVTNLSGEEAEVNDGLPAWSPDGAWIAFGRKPSRATEGTQIWIAAADGQSATAVTSDPRYFFGRPVWSPDGRYLAFQGFNLQEPRADAGVWLYDREADTVLKLAPSGSIPYWLP